MPDSTVLRWKQRGHFYVWHYRDNLHQNPGWHFHADDEGCESLMDLLTLMQQAQYSSRNTIRLTEPPPNVVGVINQGSRWYSASSLEIRYPKGRVGDDTWKLEVSQGKLLLVIGKTSLNDLAEAIQDVSEGFADGCMGPGSGDDDMVLWFW